MHSVSTLLHATARSQAWSDYVLAQPDNPPLEAPLLGLEQPARNAAALARLRRILAKRHVVEQLWFDRLNHTTARHRKIIGRQFYGTPSINLEYFDFHSTLSTLHPHRKMVQLLQQHIAQAPTVKSLWHRYAELESVQCWKQVAALDVYDFAGILLSVHLQYNDTRFFIPGSNWNVPRTWQHCTLRERPLSGCLNNCVNFT